MTDQEQPRVVTTITVSATHAAMMRKKIEAARNTNELAAAADKHSKYLVEKDRRALREVYARRLRLLSGG